MNKNNIIVLEIEEELKKKLEKICANIGITLDTAFNMFVKKLVTEGTFPFKTEDIIFDDPFYNIKIIDNIESQKS